MFNALMGGGKPKAAPAADGSKMNDAIERLDTQIELMVKKQEVVRKKASGLKAEASKQYKLPGDMNKKAALRSMKQAKMHENQAAQLDGQLDNMMAQKMALDMCALQASNVAAMQVGSAAMKDAMGDPDKVMDTMDDIAEEMDKLNEINDALSNPMGDQLDEGDLEDELAQYMADEALQDAPVAAPPAAAAAVEDAINLPAVPVAEPVDDELAGLLDFASAPVAAPAM